MTQPLLIPGMPRVGSRINAGHRIVFRAGTMTGDYAGGKMIAGACSRDAGNTSDVDKLRAGKLMGVIGTVVNSLGTVGHYAPSVYGVTTNAEAAGSTSIQAAAGVITELVRRRGTTGTFQLLGPAVANGALNMETVTYSAASGTDITVTAIVNNYVAGSLILPTDGSEEPLSLIPDGWGVKVIDTDGSTNLVVPFAPMPIAGVLDSSQIIDWPSDTSLQQWIMDRLGRAAGGKFVFDHVYG